MAPGILNLDNRFLSVVRFSTLWKWLLGTHWIQFQLHLDVIFWTVCKSTALYGTCAPRAYVSVYILYRLLDALSVNPHSSVSTAPTLRLHDRNLLTRCRMIRDTRSADRIPVGTRFPSPVQTGPGTHPASYTMGTGSFPEVKQPGRGIDHYPHLAPRLKEEYSYTSSPPLGLCGLF